MTKKLSKHSWKLSGDLSGCKSFIMIMIITDTILRWTAFNLVDMFR